MSVNITLLLLFQLIGVFYEIQANKDVLIVKSIYIEMLPNSMLSDCSHADPWWNIGNKNNNSNNKTNYILYFP
jgi:hypothetical protein